MHIQADNRKEQLLSILASDDNKPNAVILYAKYREKFPFDYNNFKMCTEIIQLCIDITKKERKQRRYFTKS